MKRSHSREHSNSVKSKRGSELESLLHSEHEVTIETLAVGGNGVARLLFNDKPVVIFVPRAAPEDRLRVRIIRAEKNHLIGEIVHIEQAGKSRRPAPCEYYDRCGGCNWQHISEDEQLRCKEDILRGLLNKFLPDSKWELLPSISSPKHFHYRNRIQLKHGEGRLGYFQRASHDIVDIERCLLADERISNEILPMKAKLRSSQHVVKYELRINHLDRFEFYRIGEDGEGLSFSQVNNSVNEMLIDASVKLAKSVSPAFITELFAGAGNFTFPFLKNLPDVRIEAVELNAKLTEFAVNRLKSENLQKRLLFFTSDCESFVKRRKISSEFVLLDPPRSGCSETVIHQVAAGAPTNVLYISCHPVNLARDLRTLTSLIPDYRIAHLQIFDMFPQTDHFETLVLLSRP